MMGHAVDPSPGMRRAALTLHALSGADRAWLLQQLSTDQRDSLTSLLAELEALGIPRDPGLIDDALASAAPTMPPEHTGLDAEGLCQVLACEPDDLRACWLSVMDATEQQAILAKWPLPLQPAPHVQAPDSRWSPALREAIRQSWIDVSQGATR